METIDVGEDAPRTVISGLVGKVPEDQLENRMVTEDGQYQDNSEKRIVTLPSEHSKWKETRITIRTNAE